jgi:hypothetical protein
MPIVLVAFVAIAGFYLVVRFGGGSGERTEGRTLVDEPEEEEEAETPPGSGKS